MKRITIKNNHTFTSGAIERLKALGAFDSTKNGFSSWTLHLKETSIEFYPRFGKGELFYMLNSRVENPEKVRLFGMSRVGKWNFLEDVATPEEALERLDVHLSELNRFLKQGVKE